MLKRLFFFFWLRHMACRILVPCPGTEPRPQQWKCQVLTTGPPGNSQLWLIFNKIREYMCVYYQVIMLPLTAVTLWDLFVYLTHFHTFLPEMPTLYFLLLYTAAKDSRQTTPGALQSVLSSRCKVDNVLQLTTQVLGRIKGRLPKGNLWL